MDNNYDSLLSSLLNLRNSDIQSIDVSTGVCNVVFNYIEQGKYDNEQDLINNGII